MIPGADPEGRGGANAPALSVGAMAEAATEAFIFLTS